MVHGSCNIFRILSLIQPRTCRPDSNAPLRFGITIRNWVICAIHMDSSRRLQSDWLHIIEVVFPSFCNPSFCALCFFPFFLDWRPRARLPSSRVEWKRLKHSSRVALQKSAAFRAMPTWVSRRLEILPIEMIAHPWEPACLSRTIASRFWPYIAEVT